MKYIYSAFAVLVILYLLILLCIVVINTKTSQIPKIINKVYINHTMTLPKQLPTNIQNAHDTWKRLNPDYKLVYWSGNDCRKYLMKYFGKHYLDVFDTIQAYSGKCNFFRYCVVYNEGGWYSDWKQIPFVSIKDFHIPSATTVICKDKGYEYVTKNECLQNCFFGSTKHNILLKKAIDVCFDHVKNKFYGNSPLDTTGVCAFGKAFKQVNLNLNTVQFCDFKHEQKEGGAIFYNNKIIIQHKCDNCGSDQNWKEGNNYNTIYYDKNYYGEKNIYNYTIPKIIHQTYSSFDKIPLCVKRVVAYNIKNNPDYVYIFYDDGKIDDFIKSHESDRVYKAFKLIKDNVGAAKADFFRYVVLYHNGGIYADIKSKLVKPLNEWIHTNKLHVTFWPWNSHSYLKKEYPESLLKRKKHTNYEINQAVLIYPKKHIILRKVIDAIVDKIENDFKHNHENNILSTTGPHIYTKIVAKELPNFEYTLYEDAWQLYNYNVVYDGTKGCYHRDQRMNKKYYNQVLCLDNNRSILKKNNKV